MTAPARIAVLCVPSPHAWIAINALAAEFGPVHVIAEERENRWMLIRRRARRQGILTVLGQIGFVLFQKLLDRKQKHRVEEIVSTYGLDPNPNEECPVYPVGSVNSMACRAALAMVDPQVVVVCGTRIIGRETLAAIRCPVINLHAGWNPKYRGQAGGYWALAEGDTEHAGVTIHLVDEGVDTGGILHQTRFESTPGDSFGTYFYLQVAAARPLLLQAVTEALEGRLSPRASSLPSRQHFHPTLWGYLRTAFARGVW